MNKYGKRLKELRVQRGYSQDELAKLLNTSRSRIGMYEQGRRQPDFEMQEAIADLFNVSIDYLFERENKDATIDPDSDLTSKAAELYAIYESLPPEKKHEFENFLRFLQSGS